MPATTTPEAPIGERITIDDILKEAKAKAPTNPSNPGDDEIIPVEKIRKVRLTGAAASAAIRDRMFGYLAGHTWKLIGVRPRLKNNGRRKLNSGLTAQDAFVIECTSCKEPHRADVGRMEGRKHANVKDIPAS